MQSFDIMLISTFFKLIGEWMKHFLGCHLSMPLHIWEVSFIVTPSCHIKMFTLSASQWPALAVGTLKTCSYLFFKKNRSKPRPHRTFFTHSWHLFTFLLLQSIILFIFLLKVAQHWVDSTLGLLLSSGSILVSVNGRVHFRLTFQSEITQFQQIDCLQNQPHSTH